MNMFRYAAALAFAFAAVFSTAALAGPLAIVSTGVDGSDGNLYPYIGADYQTTGASFAQNTVGNAVVDTLSFTTAFSGTDSVAGNNIGYADVFVGGLAISLGDQTANGGVSVAGLYQITGEETSSDIWGGRVAANPSLIYGSGVNYFRGEHTNLPTVLTSGNFIEGINVSDIKLPSGLYDLSMTFLDDKVFMNTLEKSGLFWGTGDCANGAIYAVAEPTGWALFGVGILALFLLRPKRYSSVYG